MKKNIHPKSIVEDGAAIGGRSLHALLPRRREGPGAYDPGNASCGFRYTRGSRWEC